MMQVRWFALGLCGALVLSALAARAEEPTLTDDEVVVRREGAHNLLLPKDWPVEHKDGRIAPMPVEEYLSMKFGQVKDQFAQQEQRVTVLEQRIEALEKEQKLLQRHLQRKEAGNGD